MHPFDRPVVRRIAISLLVLFGVVNLLLLDYGFNQAHALNGVRHYVPTTEPVNILTIPIDDPTQEARIHQLSRGLVLVGAVALGVWVAWLISSERRLKELGVPRERRRPAATELALDVVAPVRVLGDLLVRSTRAEGRAADRAKRTTLLAVGEIALVAFVVAVVLLLGTSSSSIDARIGRDHVAIGLGFAGMAVAAFAVVMTVWIGANQRDLAIGEPADKWQGWGSR